MSRLSQSAVLCALLFAALLPSVAFASRHKTGTPPPPPPVHASQQPVATIPVDQLGFAAPGEFYLGSRFAMVSLDFLDEDRLLFTFRVPGLFRREPNGDATETERHIRAYVLRISDGSVQAEALWTLHDRARYVLPLDSGQFLLRDRNLLSLGDASLQLTPWMRFPGPLVWVDMDPDRKLVVANSHEPEKAQPQTDSTAQTSTEPANDTVLRVLRGEPEPGWHEAGKSGSDKDPDSSGVVGQVLLVAHLRTAVHLPLNQNGYLEPLRSRGFQWLINFDYFSGGTTRVGAVDSSCVPTFDFISDAEFLANVCNPAGSHVLVALGMDGRRLWQTSVADTAIWPNLERSRNGLRLARETVAASHVVNAMSPLSASDITEQDVVVFDAANGKIMLKAQASPIFDAGGNYALSPSGRRVAVLMEGGIRIFDLPEAPPLPAPPPGVNQTHTQTQAPVTPHE